MGYLGVENFNPLPVGTLYRCSNLSRNVRAWHYHRHQDTVNPQMGIDLPLDFRHGAEQQL
jgi:hypothetical protein